ncbi:LTA synthase family protein [Sporosarcina gallistercoris]|uniref:LTA synthase family protein n=1 Tax=Sporosarcina gallistercoris TaxID=2762245 RepID=A0ABR8PF83_9BACL|nr:LTA synthase family protein [Sporosarcina gallistercoris]MBD7906820.1 LTA synthase family protein [Sporosarcina gallistercoris]
MTRFNWPKHSILLIAVLATWLTTYFGYLTSFNMSIDNMIQQLILFINPLSFLLLVYGVALFIKTTKRRNAYLITVSVLTSIVMFANAVFYRFFSDFITIPTLFQTNNFGDLSSSVMANIHGTDIFFFTDVIIVVLAVKFIPQSTETVRQFKMGRRIYFIATAALFMVNLGLAEAERPQLLTRSFDRELLVKNIGTYNYHIYDLIIQSKSHAQRVLADGSELSEVENYVHANHKEPSIDMFEDAKGRNIITISLESLQSFVINQEMDGHVITPFLNELTKDKDTFYFDNFYHQTGLGKTSDAEFIVENSIYPRNGSAVFFTHSGNTFDSMSEKLADNGYFTNVMHANNRSFWNRDIMYKALGIEKFYDVESYSIGEGQAVNWGMKDIPYFEQSVQMMKEMPQPFSSRLLTLTNHHPFDLDDEDMLIPAYTSNSKTLNKYFQTSRYLDESIKVFFEELKKNGLYDNSIIVMYGDHYGISENHNKAMSMYLNKELTPFDNTELQKVPFFIHIPGNGKGKVMHELGGQMDIRPTVLNLAGIDTKEDMQFGSDLFSKEHEDFVIFRDGRFVTDKYVYAHEVCYDAETGEPTDGELCAPYIERANKELEYSDTIINGDLLRFKDGQSDHQEADTEIKGKQ